MAITSGFKKFERYMLNTEGNWQLVSMKTSADSVILSNGTTVADMNDALPFRIEINDTEGTINFIDRR